MARSLEWLKEEVGEINGIARRNLLNESSKYTEGVSDASSDILRLIDQVEQPEVLSQEWIDDHKVARISNLRKMTMKDAVPADQLENLIMPTFEQPEITIIQALDKLAEKYPFSSVSIGAILEGHTQQGRYEQPDLPEIPDYVAAWLERHKEYNLYDVINILHQHVTKIDDYYVTNPEKVIDAKRYGYTVEEKKYYVRNKHKKTLLIKVQNNVRIYDENTSYHAIKHTYELTEKEIKDYYERYMAFAVPVDDVE